MNNTEKKQDHQPAISAPVDSADETSNSSTTPSSSNTVSASTDKNNNQNKQIFKNKNLETFSKKITTAFLNFYNKQNVYTQRTLLVFAFFGAQVLIFSLVQLSGQLNQHLFFYKAHNQPENESLSDNKIIKSAPIQSALPISEPKGTNNANNLTNEGQPNPSLASAPVLEVRASANDFKDEISTSQPNLRSEHGNRERQTQRPERQFNFPQKNNQ